MKLSQTLKSKKKGSLSFQGTNQTLTCLCDGKLDIWEFLSYHAEVLCTPHWSLRIKRNIKTEISTSL